ncbi:hypothetical protein ACH5RR_021336 [Cinchona calisaya]|uniref:Late embryogenesis abundant protein n=1 Tax=Cinchona calisaya TaxID=153742 RepID=A0ABD2ZKU2_9GENT
MVKTTFPVTKEDSNGRWVCNKDYSTCAKNGDQDIKQDSYGHDTGNLSSNQNPSNPTNWTGQEKEMDKTRFLVANEVRMAKDAEAAMDLHVNKATEKIAHQEAKCIQNLNANQFIGDPHQDTNGRIICDSDYSTRATYGD